LKNKVDVIITDCPLFLFMYYGKKESENFKNLALELFNRNDNMTYFLNRVKKFNPAGRVQDEAKSKQIDAELLELLNLHSVKYARIDADGDAAKKIASDVLERLNNGQR
jgi:hypothetical protein